MKHIILACVAGLALSGCQLDSQVAKVSNSEQFTKLCQKAPTIHFAFNAIAALVQQDKIGKVLEAENTAYGIIIDTCANPPTDTITALTTIQNAYATILDQQKKVVQAQPKA